MKTIANAIITEWNKLRADRPIDKQDHLKHIFKNQIYKGYYEKLSGDEKKTFQ